MSFSYSNIVSRTLTPQQRSLRSVIGIHDHEISDADVNLIQDLQDYKRHKLLQDTTSSGCLTYSEFQFNPYINNTFTVPAFDVMFDGDVVTIGGNGTASLSSNVVALPSPIFWTNGASGDPASLFVIYLELWYQELNSNTQAGYYVDSNGLLYYYPNGCVNALPINMIPNDSVDTFSGSDTTHRAQVQWGLRAQRIDMAYNFGLYNFGLDAGADSAQTVWAQASQNAPITSSPYSFTNLGLITGDAGLWRAGDGNVTNDLGTMDGYSYALPVGLILQKNTGPFDISLNIYGCANPQVAGSGLIQSAVSGRYDRRFADSIWADMVIDTRQTISLSGWDNGRLMKDGFGNVITGTTRSAIVRGDSSGDDSNDIGALLTYNVGVGSSIRANVNAVGNFNGFFNGFSTDQRIFNTTKAISVNSKTVGFVGGPWLQNDAFAINLGSNSGIIEDISVQALVTNSDGSKTPVLLIAGQLNIAGIGSSAVTVSFVDSLTGTSYDPGQNNLYVTLGVQQPVGTGINLNHIPEQMYGGTLYDGGSGQQMTVFPVSEYETRQAQVALSAQNLWTINPEYSSSIFGTRAWIYIPGSQGQQQTLAGNAVTLFTMYRAEIETNLVGLYVVRAWDLVSGNFYTIVSRAITSGQIVFTLSGLVPTTSTLVVSVLMGSTAQLAYNAAVKGVTSLEETFMFGNYLGDASLSMDSRESLVSQSGQTLVFASSEGILKGIAGDDTNQFIWTQVSAGVFQPLAVASVNFSMGLTTIVVPTAVDLTQPYFFIGAFLPSFSSSSQLIISYGYVPYQGEGILNRDYQVIKSESEGLITTNGTGAAPIPGLMDVYPYNRELPIITTLPSQINWDDSILANQPVQSFFDSNFVAKKYSNIEHTLAIPLHTNDFIDPIDQDKSKLIRLVDATNNRGFAKATPHVGFAIDPPTLKSSISSTTASTTGSIVLYVDNVNGSDSNDGLALTNPMLTITNALNTLPPILRHPCSIQLLNTGVAYDMQALSSTLEQISLGDGTIRSAEYFALGNIAFSVQESGRLVVTPTAGTTSQVLINATDYVANGNGPTYAFFVDNTRVLFNQIQFQGFTDGAIYGIASDIEFVNCSFVDNVTSCSFDQGCDVVMTGGTLDISNGTGIVLSGSQLLVSDMNFIADTSGVPGVFFVAERASSLSLQTHTPSQDSNITSAITIAQASINSSIVCATDFSTSGSASLQMLSVLSRTVTVNPFLGGISSDSSSSVQTQV